MKKKDIISLLIWISGFFIILLTILYVAPLVGYFIRSDSALGYVNAKNNFVAYGGHMIVTKNYFRYYFGSVIPVLALGMHFGRLLMCVSNKDKKDKKDSQNLKLKF